MAANIAYHHSFNINFFNLHAALIAGAAEYAEHNESEKTTNLVAKVVKTLRNFFSRIPKSKDPALAENIRQIVPFLDPGPQNQLVESDNVTQDQRMLLLLAQALIRSNSKELCKAALRHLIELHADEDGNITSFGNKAFYDNSHYALELSRMCIYRPSFIDRICAAKHLLQDNTKKIRSLSFANQQSLDSLLTQPPANSITRVPLILRCIRKLRRGTALDAVPMDLVKVIATLVQADMKSQVLKQLIGVALPVREV